jgi:pimeloyl-ACP methyl ester carboxylesterase
VETLALEYQVRDLEAILAQEKVERAVFLGWSMGVQFNFEYYRRHADQVVGLVALNGAAGHPFSTVGHGRFMVARLVPLLARAMKVGSPFMNRGTRILAHWEGFVPLLQGIGLVAPTLDRDVFVDLAREYATVDFDAYAETFLQLGHHDATDLLHRIQVPTLIIAGSRDLFTPVSAAEKMAAAIPDARLVVIQGGTHYAAVEFPREVNEHLRDFLKRLGHGDIP